MHGKGEFKWDIYTDSYMMDFENWCLENKWDSSVAPHPKGPKRHEDKAWSEMIKSQAFPNHSDIDWYDYSEWVSRGGGDEWFQEEVNG